MKKLLRILMLAVSFVCVFTTSAYADETNESEVYTYPVQKGTEEWAEFTTHAQQIEATQIPSELLDVMSTEDLLESVLEYPLLVDVFAYDTYAQGIQMVAQYFNGLEELLSRSDLATVLIDRYSIQIVPNLSVFTSKNNLDETIGASNEYLKMNFLEVMLAQSNVLNTLEEADSVRLNNLLIDKYEEKSISGMYEMGLYTFDLAVAEGYEEGTLRAEPNYRVGDIVYTPNNSPVNTLKCIADYSTSERAAWDRYYEETYPNATYLSESTAKYNCHAYAWYAQDTTMRVWIESSEAAKYITDGSYTRREGWPGYLDKIYYEGGVHSGIICSAVGKVVQSKWGKGPLMQHMYNYGPYANESANATYYDR